MLNRQTIGGVKMLIVNCQFFFVYLLWPFEKLGDVRVFSDITLTLWRSHGDDWNAHIKLKTKVWFRVKSFYLLLHQRFHLLHKLFSDVMLYAELSETSQTFRQHKIHRFLLITNYCTILRILFRIPNPSQRLGCI